MRISELEAQLAAMREKHGDLHVAATWESIFRPVEIYRGNSDAVADWCSSLIGLTDEEILEGILLIDADDGCYRGEYEHPDDKAPPEPEPQPTDQPKAPEGFAGYLEGLAQATAPKVVGIGEQVNVIVDGEVYTIRASYVSSSEALAMLEAHIREAVAPAQGRPVCDDLKEEIKRRIQERFG